MIAKLIKCAAFGFLGGAIAVPAAALMMRQGRGGPTWGDIDGAWIMEKFVIGCVIGILIGIVKTR